MTFPFGLLCSLHLIVIVTDLIFKPLFTSSYSSLRWNRPLTPYDLRNKIFFHEAVFGLQFHDETLVLWVKVQVTFSTVFGGDSCVSQWLAIKILVWIILSDFLISFWDWLLKGCEKEDRRIRKWNLTTGRESSFLIWSLKK